MQQKELKALVSLLDDDDPEVLKHVEQKIVSIGEEIIPLLEQEWELIVDKSAQTRIENLIHHLQFQKVKNDLLTWINEEEQDLLKGMHILATYQYPDLNFLSLKQQIDQLYHQAWLKVKSEMHPYDQIRSLNQFFFSENKFQANKKNFHSPNNSFLNIVLETRKGIPLTMSVVYLLVAERLGLPVYGVNLPNLFILTYKSPEKQFYVNVYNSGLIFSREDIDNYIKQLGISPLDIFYQPCSNLSIIKRCIRNLIGAYEFNKMDDKVKEMNDILLSISDGGENI